MGRKPTDKNEQNAGDQSQENGAAEVKKIPLHEWTEEDCLIAIQGYEELLTAIRRQLIARRNGTTIAVLNEESEG